MRSCVRRFAYLLVACSLPVLAAPIVDLSRSSVSGFYSHFGDTSNVQSLVLTNVGTDPLEIGTVSLTGSGSSTYFVMGPCAAGHVTLAPGERCLFELRFTPNGTQTNATLSIASNAAGSPHTIPLFGNIVETGVGVPYAFAHFTPPYADYAAQAVGTSSPATSITVTSAGSGRPFTISSIALGGRHPGDFTFTSTCPVGNALAIGTSCTIDVHFAPTADGPRSAEIDIKEATLSSAFPVALTGVTSAANQANANYEGLWWATGGVESGWGINLAHQGDTIFGTWFTYDASGNAWWLSVTANKNADGSFSGTLYEAHGPAFNAVPFLPTQTTRTDVGNATLAFSSATSGTFTYTVRGITQTKSIEPLAFGPLPVCRWNATSDLSTATNYQDIWWAAPSGIEAGWGVNLAHQGDMIFATWFTYDVQGNPLWYSVTADPIGSRTFSGTLYRGSGPAFDATPFVPGQVHRDPVGTATFAFTNGNAGTFSYLLSDDANVATQTKPITRLVFAAPGTICQ